MNLEGLKLDQQNLIIQFYELKIAYLIFDEDWVTEILKVAKKIKYMQSNLVKN